MSTFELSLLRPAVSWHRSTLAEWNALDVRTRTRSKVAALVIVTVVAYHYSLVSLVQTVGLDTPLAYVGLVPFLAGGLAWLNRVPGASELPIYDRQLDYIIGVPLLSIAVLAGVVLPAHLGAMYWVNRLDLLFLPVFVAGATVLLFGVRVAWRQKAALAYLFLGWPWLYTSVLLGTLGGFTAVTLRGLNAALDVLHVATPVAGNAGLFAVAHNGRAILVSVVTACSGVDGMVGFLLIGAALTSVVKGSLVRKVLWLAAGLVLLWATNLLRLLLIFWAARVAGRHFALDVLHPVAGVVMFCVAVALMSVLLRPFGLSRVKSDGSPSSETGSSSAAPRVFAVVTILLGAAIVLSISDAGLRVFNPVASATGEPKLGSFLADPADPAGWRATFDTEYFMNKPLFGQDSRWFRYTYTPTLSEPTSLHSTLPVTADVIDASGLGGFSAYGVTACYSFHGYALKDVATVTLGDGIKGQALSYSGGTSTSRQDWSIVYWIMPVKTGGGTRYERVILYLQNTSSAKISVSPQAAGTAQLDREVRAPDAVQRRLVNNRAFLEAFARQIIAGQSAQRDTSVLVDAVQTPNVQWTASTRASGTGTASSAGAATSSSSGSLANAAFWEAYDLKHPRSPASAQGW